MVEYFIVLAFYLPNGRLESERTGAIPTRVECERLLPIDLKARMEVWGNATGYCLAAPVKPKGLPEPKRKGSEA